MGEKSPPIRAKLPAPVRYRGVEAWLRIEDSTALPEKYVTVSLYFRPRRDGESVPAFTADVRIPDSADSGEGGFRGAS